MKEKRKTKPARKSAATALMCAPIIIWSALFIITPMAILVFISFMSKGTLGKIDFHFTLSNYAGIFKPVYYSVVAESVRIALWTTVITVLMGYPFAFHMAAIRRKTSGLILIFLMLPLWVSGIVILYSYVILLGSHGIINTTLLNLGLIKEPLELLYNDFAVIVGMVYMFLPLAILPMYSAAEKLDRRLLEASSDLGAGPVQTFFRITFPNTAPGIFAAVILTFIPCIGYYMVTDMLGGGTTMMAGNLIYRQFTIARNWPFGAAVSVVLGAIILLMVWIYTKVGGSLDDL
ncbi:MAG: ABC transporter permease [Eubacterium sp.]|nr:ABC transporter permease [Eubacterium sp.]